MARKSQTFSKRTRYDRFEETVRTKTEAIVSYETPRKKFTTHDLKNIHPKTYAQERVFEAYQQGGNSLVLTGSAGTGKTFLAVYLALQEILSGETPFKKLLIIRSTTPIRDQGFLPGSIEEKEAIYEMPYKQLCNDIFTRPGQYEKLKESGVIEFVSTSYVRGLTFKDSIVVMDEAQNYNYQELSSCITRAGNNCKYFVCGDTMQSDLLYKKTDVSGLPEFLEILKMIPSFRGVTFGIEDIVRSGLVKEFLVAEERLAEIQARREFLKEA
jgi:phosphate starvation-inducible PhoH-like protein